MCFAHLLHQFPIFLVGPIDNKPANPNIGGSLYQLRGHLTYSSVLQVAMGVEQLQLQF
jgi:hypothetical protein